MSSLIAVTISKSCGISLFGSSAMGNDRIEDAGRRQKRQEESGTEILAKIVLLPRLVMVANTTDEGCRVRFSWALAAVGVGLFVDFVCFRFDFVWHTNEHTRTRQMNRFVNCQKQPQNNKKYCATALLEL